MKKTALLCAGLLLAGCAEFGYGDGYANTAVPTEPDLVTLRLAKAAEKASDALDTIAGIEQYRTPNFTPQPDFSGVPPALMQPITIKWAGPVEQILETLAARAGMHFSVEGNRPGAPLLVNLNVYQKPMIEVLHDLGLQIGRRGDVFVDNATGVIGLSYAPVDRM